MSVFGLLIIGIVAGSTIDAGDGSNANASAIEIRTRRQTAWQAFVSALGENGNTITLEDDLFIGEGGCVQQGRSTNQVTAATIAGGRTITIRSADANQRKRIFGVYEIGDRVREGCRIFNVGGTLNLQNVIIQGGSQYGLGAAIHVTGGGLLNAVNSDFLNGDNNQHPGGSVAVANNANFSCTGCRFVGNSGRNGGAIYYAPGSSGTLNDCYFEDNDGQMGSHQGENIYGHGAYFYGRNANTPHHQHGEPEIDIECPSNPNDGQAMSLAECEGCEGSPNCPDPCSDCDDSWPVSRRPTASPTSTAPTTAGPTASPTTSPTKAPSPAPIVNTVTDCGRHHVDCGGQLGSAYQGDGISCPAPRGNPNGRCVCAGPYHCCGTEQRGACADPRDHCFERGITASPSTAPSSSHPTALPTSLPTATPTSSLPTAAPTAAPTATPTAAPTTTYARDFYGNVIFPTDAGGNENYVTDTWGRPIIPTDQNGLPVTIPPLTTTTITTTTTARPDDRSSSGSAGSSDSGDSLGVVVGVAAVLLVLVIGAAWLYVQNATKGGDGLKAGFENPAYESGPTTFFAAPSAAAASTGYMDVPAGMGAAMPAAYDTVDLTLAAAQGYMDVAPGTSGYMDVAPTGGDDEEEDV